MPRAKRDRPNFPMPGHPWNEYIEYLEGKVGRLEAERDKLTGKLQQPSLLGDGFESQAADPRGDEEGFKPSNALFGDGDDPDDNRLGGFTRDSETSRKAALANFPRSGNQRHQILVFVFKKGAYGATFDECRQGLGIYSSDRRISELVEGAWLDRTSRTRKTTQGEEATVVVASDKAVEWIRTREPLIYREVNRR